MQEDNTMKSELHNRATMTRHVAMLLLLRRLFRDAVTFCAFQKMQKLMTAEKRAGNNDQPARGRSLPDAECCVRACGVVWCGVVWVCVCGVCGMCVCVCHGHIPVRFI